MTNSIFIVLIALNVVHFCFPLLVNMKNDKFCEKLTKLVKFANKLSIYILVSVFRIHIFELKYIVIIAVLNFNRFKHKIFDVKQN